jgi:hypothetical protein
MITKNIRKFVTSPSPIFVLLLSSAPQPSIGLGFLHKIRLNFLEAYQQFSFYRVGLLAPRQTPIPEDQTPVFISPRGRVATHFSRLLRHACVTVGLFLLKLKFSPRYGPLLKKAKTSIGITITTTTTTTTTTVLAFPFVTLNSSTI